MTKASNELKAGASAPAFSLKNQKDEIVSSKDLFAEKTLLYFYPKASTPGCTVQACSIRDSLKIFAKISLNAVGISPDLPEKLKKFDEKHGLGFTLLSDPDMAIAKAYGVVGEKTMFGKKKIGIIRSSFLIDENGKILRAWYKVKPAETVALALNFIEENK